MQSVSIASHTKRHCMYRQAPSFALVVFIVSGFLTLSGCGGISSSDGWFQRKNTEETDKKWTSFEKVRKSFEEIKARIDSGKTVSITDLEYRGFGPSSNNATKIIYTDLEDLFIGAKGDRARLPKDIEACTQKKGGCYGLLVKITYLNKKGTEGIFERLMTKKKTEIRGWGFAGVFAIEKRGKEQVVVAAYPQKEEANISRSEDGSDPRGPLVDSVRFGSMIPFF